MNRKLTRWLPGPLLAAAFALAFVLALPASAATTTQSSYVDVSGTRQYSVNSCDARPDTAPFACPGTPSRWICGPGPSYQCPPDDVQGSWSTPTCYNNQYVNCEADYCGVPFSGNSCVCQAGLTKCAYSCQTPVSAVSCNGFQPVCNPADAPNSPSASMTCDAVNCASGYSKCDAPSKCTKPAVACAAGQTWDACAEVCVDKFIYASPTTAQNDFIRITNGITTEGGMLTVYATAADLAANQNIMFGNMNNGSVGNLLLLERKDAAGTGVAASFKVDKDGVLQAGKVPWARLTAFNQCPAGQYIQNFNLDGSLACSAVPNGIASWDLSNLSDPTKVNRTLQPGLAEIGNIDLGDPTYQWGSLYLTQDANVGGDVVVGGLVNTNTVLSPDQLTLASGSDQGILLNSVYDIKFNSQGVQTFAVNNYDPSIQSGGITVGGSGVEIRGSANLIYGNMDTASTGKLLLLQKEGVTQFQVAGDGNVTAGSSLKLLETGASPQYYGNFSMSDLTADRTYTLPNATGTVITTGNLNQISGTGTLTAGSTGTGFTIDFATSTETGALGPSNGGTGQSTYAQGDILYASAANTLSKRTIGALNQVLTVDATGVPVWASPQLTGANTALSNLAAVAINTSLLPGVTDSIDLGSDGRRWKDIYLGAETLHIGTDTTDEGKISYDTGNNRLKIDVPVAASGSFAINTNAFYFDEPQKRIGLGTSTPRQSLDIFDSATTAARLRVTDTAQNPEIQLQYTLATGEADVTNDNHWSIYADKGVADPPLRIWGNANGDANRLTILGDASGNVGIGVDSPSSFKLQVAGNVGPNTTAASDLGSATTKWRDLFLSGAVKSGAWQGTPVAEAFGGTNQSGYAKGDILYASAVNVLSKLPISADGKVLVLSGGLPTWGASPDDLQAVTTRGPTTDKAITISNTLSLGSTTLNLTGAGSNLAFGVMKKDGTTGSLLLLQTHDGSTYNDQFRVDKDGRVTVKNSIGNNAEVRIQSEAAADSHWAVLEDRTTHDLRFWKQEVVDEQTAAGFPTSNKGYPLTMTKSGDVKIYKSNCVGSTYRGRTSLNVAGGGQNGSISNGYKGANDACHNALAGTHVCSSEEILRTVQCAPASLPGSISPLVEERYWINVGAPGLPSPAVNDCEGWQSATSGSYGGVWVFTGSNGGKGMAVTCTFKTQFACCGDW